MGQGRNAGVDEVLRQMPDELMRLLMNWQRDISREGLGYARSSAFSDTPGGACYYGPSIPVLRGESEDVDNALAQLPIQDRQAVAVFWQNGCPALSWVGRVLSPPPLKPIDYRTVKARLLRGHLLLIGAIRRQRHHARHYADAARKAHDA